MARTLLQNGTVLTMDPEFGDVAGGDVLIEDGRIAAVGPDLDPGGADVIDATNHIVIPGLVNTHAHLFQTGVRGIAGDWTLATYRTEMLSTLRPRFEPEDVYLGDLFGAFEQLDAGVTTVLDWCHTINTPEYANRAVDALRDAGIRAVFAYGPPGIDRQTWYGDSSRTHPEDVRRMHGEYLRGVERVSLALAIRGPDLSTYEVTAHDIRLARELGVPASMHVAVGAFDEREDHDLPRLADDGLLGPDVNLVHANTLREDVYPLLADAGASVSVLPEVELQMGHGLPATGDVRSVGGRAVLGTDVVSAVRGDMFTQMRFALQVQRGLDNADVLAGGAEVETLDFSARDVLRMATIEGARAAGLGDEVGSLTPGKRADVALLAADDVNTFPNNDPVSTVVLQCGPGNVDSVFVGGEQVKANGELRNPAVRERRDDLLASSRRILGAADGRSD